MPETYEVSLWDGPDNERLVSIESDDPRDAAVEAERQNPGWEAWFISGPGIAGGTTILDPLEPGRYALLEDEWP